MNSDAIEVVPYFFQFGSIRYPALLSSIIQCHLIDQGR